LIFNLIFVADREFRPPGRLARGTEYEGGYRFYIELLGSGS
jgi:hypothetical protein